MPVPMECTGCSRKKKGSLTVKGHSLHDVWYCDKGGRSFYLENKKINYCSDKIPIIKNRTLEEFGE